MMRSCRSVPTSLFSLAALIGILAGCSLDTDTGNRQEPGVGHGTEPPPDGPAARALLEAQVGAVLHTLGETDRGARALEQAVDRALSLSDPSQRDEVLHHVANDVASADRFDRALDLLDRVEALEFRTKLAWKLVNKLGKAGEPESARTILESIEGPVSDMDPGELKAELLSGTGSSWRFVDARTGAPLVYEAFGMAQMVSNPYHRAVLLNELGARLVDVEDVDRARRSFELVRGTLDEIGDPLERGHVLAMLGGEQAEKGLRDEAAEDLETGVVAAMEAPAGEARDAIVSEIARNFSQAFRFERALEVAELIEDPYHRAEAYIRTVKNLQKQDRNAEALELLEETAALTTSVTNSYLRGILHRKIADEWQGIGRRDEAVRSLEAALEAAEAL